MRRCVPSVKAPRGFQTRHWKWLLMLALTGMGALYFVWKVSSDGCRQLLGEVYCRMPMETKLVALTFDDGPSRKGVEQVLPILDRYGAKATFFLNGDKMVQWPEGARKIAAAGHELGNHGYNHVPMIGRLPGFYRDQVERTDALLRQAGEERPIAFRPPYGRRFIGLPMAVERAGYVTVTWTVHEPPEGGTPEDYAAHILAQVRHGGIILLHPMYERHETVVAALPLILEGLDQLGFTTVTVTELLREGGVIARGEVPERTEITEARRAMKERLENGIPLTFEERALRGF